MHSNTSSFSFCVDIEYNSTGVANPRLYLLSSMRLLRNYMPDVPLDSMHNNKCLVSSVIVMLVVCDIYN